MPSMCLKMAFTMQRLFSLIPYYTFVPVCRGAMSCSYIHTSITMKAGGNWREQRGMSRTGTSYGPLTDLPDWAYLDGRPAPPVLSKRQLKRKRKQQAIAKRIEYLLKVVDNAKETHGQKILLKNKTSDSNDDNIDGDYTPDK